MSARRAPTDPPLLDGFTYVDVLGSGGFADVFLYQQQLPRRRVAVKVLLGGRITSGSVEEFTAEANVMAMLSTHPSIVTIHQAGIADDGRPYLVMEYCPRPNLQVRYRREPFSVAETLRVGIQVAGAVETAHRADVLHRDIKPANVLVTEYNRPALTDFGIASSTAAGTESSGLSIPWSPPEVFADIPRSSLASDVYSLGATVYSLLAGRSPFETTGERVGAAELMHRIETAPLPPLSRGDVPDGLWRALERSMAKSAADRFGSALSFARALQEVEVSLTLPVTPVDILDDGGDSLHDDTDDGRTRVRSLVSIDPEAAGRPVSAIPEDPAERTLRRERVDETMVRPLAPTGASQTQSPPTGTPHWEDAPATTTSPAVPRRPRRLWPWIVGVAAAAIVIVVIAVSLPAMLGGTVPAPTPSGTADPKQPIVLSVPAPSDLVGVVNGAEVVFTWTNPSPQDGDRYAWSLITLTEANPTLSAVDEETVTVPVDPSGTTCVEVRTVRSSGQESEPVRGCVP